MMKRVLFAACLVLATAGNAAAQQGLAQLHADALPGQPLRVQFEAGTGIVLDAGAAVSPDHDNLILSHVPPGSGWILELPAVVTVEGAQRVRVTCNVSSLTVNVAGGPFSGGIDFRAGDLLGATEHTFETGGSFLGRIVLGVPRIVASSAPANLMHCAVVVFGARNGVDWRAFEMAAPGLLGGNTGGSPTQYVVEAGDTRLLTGATFRRQVVLSADGYALTGQ